MELDPGNTPKGGMPPFEVAKALAFDVVIKEMEEHMQKTCWELLGMSRKELTASHLQVVGGGNPSARAVQKHWTKAKKYPKWFPGKGDSSNRGRPPSITFAQKKAIAQKAMDLKEEIVAPTPEKIRILLPKKTINEKTKDPISAFTIKEIFKTMAYDEEEDDPWQFLSSLQQDALTDEMKPPRVKTAKHVLDNITENQAWNLVAIDPCISLLPKNQ